MPCSHIRVGGVTAILCGKQRIRTCVACGAIADLECDWKIGGGKTCDRPICSSCSCSPAPKKDLCSQHAAEWNQHPRNKAGQP